MKVVVMGAGLAGVTTAWELARDGHEVVVIERERQVASVSSFANGGIVAANRASIEAGLRARFTPPATRRGTRRCSAVNWRGVASASAWCFACTVKFSHWIRST